MIRFLQTPSKTKKIVLGSMLTVIAAAMVITLIPGGLMTDSSVRTAGILAKVGDREVTTQDVRVEADRQGRQMFPRGTPANFRPFLVQQAAQNLVGRMALLVEADRLGLHANDDEVRDYIRSSELGPVLYPEGKAVDTNALQQFTQQMNMSVDQFFEAVRNDIILRKLTSMVEAGVVVTGSELTEAYNRTNTKVKFDYAVLRAEDVAKNIVPTDEELRAYFNINKDRYKGAIPEKRKAKYIVINLDSLAATAEVTADDLRRFYNQRQDSFRQPEQVDVRHILIKTPLPGPDGKVDEKGVEAAKQKAEDILKQLRGGANFADLAKKYTEDADSKQNGGLYTAVKRGRMVKEFEESAFSLKPGELSGLVRTSYGFHILKTEAHRQARVLSIEEVRPQLEPLVRREKAMKRGEELANKLESQAKAQGMEKAALANGLQLVTTDWFTASDTLPGLGNAPDVMQSFFTAPERSAPAAARYAQGFAVYQVTEVKPAATPTFEEIKVRVAGDYKNERSGQLLAQKTQELADRAHALKDLRKAAKELGATVKTSELVTLGSQVPDIGPLTGQAANALSNLDKGQISGAIPAGPNGVVVALLDKVRPTEAEARAGQDRMREQLLDRKRQQAVQLFAANLIKQMEQEGKLRYNEDERKRLTTAGS